MTSNATDSRESSNAENAPRAANLSDGPTQPTSASASPATWTPPPRWQYLLAAFCFKIRGLLAVLLLFAMFFTTYGVRANSVLNWSVGLALFLPAWFLRIRSQQYLRYRLREEGGLAVDGPYAYVRNPVYIANIAGVTALCLCCGLYWMAPIAAVWAFFVYHMAVRFEEMRLTKRFGESYVRYCERVPRWIPLRSPAASAGAGRASLGRAVGREWQNLLLLLVPLAKEWGPHTHTGKVHEFLAAVTHFVATHPALFVVVLVVGIAALAGWNIRHMRAVTTAKMRASRAEQQ